MKIVSSIRFEERGTEIVTCFTNHLAFFVSLKVTSRTEIELESNVAKLLKHFC